MRMSKPLILMYHRIAEEPVDYWGLAVSPAHFEEHLCVLRRTRHPVSLAEFVARQAAETLPCHAVALTFDDGYVDNLSAGLPRLAAADVPATVFLATGYIDKPEPFWWDELASLMLCGNAPEEFEIVVNDVIMGIDFGSEAPAVANGALSMSLLVKRRAALEAIYQPLRRLGDEERTPIVKKLRAAFARRDVAAPTGRPMTSAEVRQLATAGLVTIGAHTVTHPILTDLEATACQNELTASKLACEAMTQGPVTAFAYPHGEFNAAVCETVKATGFAFACSTRRGPAVTGSDIFALPRIYVPDLDGDAFEQRLQWACSLV
jgi:peptidoglycan/xylan/chitin deacetylase (PgdA/CDA1 family)